MIRREKGDNIRMAIEYLAGPFIFIIVYHMTEGTFAGRERGKERAQCARWYDRAPVQYDMKHFTFPQCDSAAHEHPAREAQRPDPTQVEGQLGCPRQG